MNYYNIKYRHNPTQLIKLFIIRAFSPEDAEHIIMDRWDGHVLECEEIGHVISLELERLDKYCEKKDAEIDELNAEIELLEEVNQSTTANLVSELANIKDLQSNIEDLESSLVTARYYIYLSGMCGFLLGLACLFLVV